MAQQKRDLADRRLELDGTCPAELRAMGLMAAQAHQLQDAADTAEIAARFHDTEYRQKMRQIAADAYALWRLIEMTCQPIVEAWEREQDARDTEEVEAKDAEEIAQEDDNGSWDSRADDEAAYRQAREEGYHAGVFEQRERYD